MENEEILIPTKAVTPIGDFGCQSFPLIEDNVYHITEEELTKLGSHELKWSTEEYEEDEDVLDEEGNPTGEAKKVTKTRPILIPNDPSEEIEERERAELRSKRLTVFKAFDIYKSNVKYGVIEESEDTHNSIVSWYQLCLDLDKDAINNPPYELEKYL